ncbi:DUF29 domain-containing protein [Lichenihabitans sp. Uapishka_5]|uniref:DUF29 domain-containing protein n=1 Tax=Lichenihabitans sp. Uapishka_5 TaxID=3037302 RepID=UPI0029E81EF8|nr:DUF29 domain-containing protein [Lichenihabitans sp. Uapishka_5]MDX7952535.1 DUF29 domain-containing protein [Lichenihabitans sp. Uapishka_5]
MSQHRRNDLSYAEDFYGWSHQQAERLRAGDWTGVDAVNLAEEIETLGRSEAAALRSSLRLVAIHLLKFRYQPQRASRSWRVTVERERINAERSLDENPSLKPRLAELFAQAYADARRLAAAETRLAIATFPVEPPFSLDELRHGSTPAP